MDDPGDCKGKTIEKMRSGAGRSKGSWPKSRQKWAGLVDGYELFFLYAMHCCAMDKIHL